MVARKYLISGRVQGVGYRYFTQRVARELRLSGWVRNLADGRVEAYATGTPARLARFESELRVGPPMADVRGVEIQEAAPGGEPAPPGVRIEGFSIR